MPAVTQNTSLSDSALCILKGEAMNVNTPTINEIFVGIDTASDKHDYKIMADNEAALGHGTITNTKKDAEKLIRKIKNTGKYPVTVGIEATNNYHLCLTRYLQSSKLKVIVINPSKRVHTIKSMIMATRQMQSMQTASAIS